MSAAKADCTLRSVRVSMELVASSRMSMGGFASITRVMHSSCRWPCDRLTPPASGVSYPCGSLRMNSSA